MEDGGSYLRLTVRLRFHTIPVMPRVPVEPEVPSCVVMDLVVTKQVEDPHVVYAVGDDEADKEVGQEVVVRDNSSKGLGVLWCTE